MADRVAVAPTPDPPSGPLILKGGGVVGVQTEAMSAAAVQILALDAVLHEIARSARSAPNIVGAGQLLVAVPLDPSADSAADSGAHTVATLARSTADRTDRLGRELRAAATAYRDAEEAARAFLEEATEAGAGLIGRSGVLLLQGLFGAALGAWLAWALTPGTSEEKSARLAIWMRENPGLVTTPEFVTVVRCIAGALDDALLPYGPMPDPLRPRPPGSGVELGGDAVLAAGSAVGLFMESSVRVSRVSAAGGTAPPAGIADRLRRIPEGDQVRIERYAAPGRPTRWIVYVDPTETFTPKPTGEPWDLTSNIGGVAGRAAGSFRATEAAMRDAGIRPTDPVAFVGFSQGGLVAGMLAGSGQWNTQGLETFGGPIGNIPLPNDLPGMTVRHTDDFVPALAGPDLPSERLLVEQRAFTGPIPTDEFAPAHQRESYDRTAADIDATTSPEVRAQLETMRRFAADQAARPGAESETLLYRAERTGEWRPAVLEPRVPRPYGVGAG